MHLQYRRYLGYSTDNGAYYYYQTEAGSTYEQTMIDVARYAKKVGLPYRYWLADSCASRCVHGIYLSHTFTSAPCTHAKTRKHAHTHKHAR